MSSTDSRPMVSIGMMAYNHERYIATAIESVLRQEVNFTYELIIAEDCSTDRTREIVIDYQKRYPDVIKLILHDKNVGMQENSACLRRACRGKYRANLEGDDYWLVTDKLQTQVDFLESNPEYIAIGGDFVCVNDYGEICDFPWGDKKNTYCQDDEYTVNHLGEWLLPAHISATLFRNVFYDCPAEVLKRFESAQILGDRRVYLFLVLQGRIRCEKRTVMVRRVLTKSSTSFTSALKKTGWQEINYHWLCEAEKYAMEAFNYRLDLSKRKELHWVGSLRMCFYQPTRANFQIASSIYKKSNKKIRYSYLFIKYLFLKIIHVFKRDGFLNGIKNIIKKFISFTKKLMKQKKYNNCDSFNPIANSFSK